MQKGSQLAAMRMHSITQMLIILIGCFALYVFNEMNKKENQKLREDLQMKYEEIKNKRTCRNNKVKPNKNTQNVIDNVQKQSSLNTSNLTIQSQPLKNVTKRKFVFKRAERKRNNTFGKIQLQKSLEKLDKYNKSQKKMKKQHSINKRQMKKVKKFKIREITTINKNKIIFKQLLEKIKKSSKSKEKMNLEKIKSKKILGQKRKLAPLRLSQPIKVSSNVSAQRYLQSLNSGLIKKVSQYYKPQKIESLQESNASLLTLNVQSNKNQLKFDVSQSESDVPQLLNKTTPKLSLMQKNSITIKPLKTKPDNQSGDMEALSESDMDLKLQSTCLTKKVEDKSLNTLKQKSTLKLKLDISHQKSVLPSSLFSNNKSVQKPQPTNETPQKQTQETDLFGNLKTTQNSQKDQNNQGGLFGNMEASKNTQNTLFSGNQNANLDSMFPSLKKKDNNMNNPFGKQNMQNNPFASDNQSQGGNQGNFMNDLLDIKKGGQQNKSNNANPFMQAASNNQNNPQQPKTNNPFLGCM